MITSKKLSFNNKKIALVLSGGVTKAASWHIGVAKALNELGFTFKSNHSSQSELEISTYVGSSAGSLICLYLAAGFTPEDIIKAYLTKARTKLKPVDYGAMLSLKRYPHSANSKKEHYNPFSHFPFIIEKTLKPLL
jgi:predicted acylesterase/phospholipase RssA